MGKVLHELKLPSKPQRFHCDIVEYSFQGKQILGLDPFEEQMGFLPWPQAVEYQKRVFSGGWVRDFLKSGQESNFRVVTVIEPLGKLPELFDLRIVRVRRAFLPLMGEHGAFGLGGVNPGGLWLGQELGLVLGRFREGGCG